MIPVYLHEFIFIPLALALAALFLCGLYYSARNAAPGTRGSRSRIYRCASCEHVYVDTRDVPLARCERCGFMNEAVKR